MQQGHSQQGLLTAWCSLSRAETGDKLDVCRRGSWSVSRCGWTEWGWLKHLHPFWLRWISREICKQLGISAKSPTWLLYKSNFAFFYSNYNKGPELKSTVISIEITILVQIQIAQLKHSNTAIFTLIIDCVVIRHVVTLFFIEHIKPSVEVLFIGIFLKHWLKTHRQLQLKTYF